MLKEEKFRICILRMMVRMSYVAFWIASAFYSRNNPRALDTALTHIRNMDESVEWYLGE